MSYSFASNINQEISVNHSDIGANSVQQTLVQLPRARKGNIAVVSSIDPANGTVVAPTVKIVYDGYIVLRLANISNSIVSPGNRIYGISLIDTRDISLPLEVGMIGTSHIQFGDPIFRKTSRDNVLARKQLVRFIGTRRQGPSAPFDDDFHDGEPASLIESRINLLLTTYGFENLFKDGRWFLFEAWTNNLRQPIWIPGEFQKLILTAFRAMRDAWRSLQRITVLNQWDILESVDPLAHGRVDACNDLINNTVYYFNRQESDFLIDLVDAHKIVGPAGTENYVDQYHLSQTGYSRLYPFMDASSAPTFALN